MRTMRKVGDKSPIDYRAFIEALTIQFPEVAADIDPEIEGGLIHLEIAAFCRFTEDAIQSGNREIVARCFEFADWLLSHGDKNVKNAVYVSYLEHLDLDDKAKSLMSPALRQGWIDINEYLSRISREANEKRDKST